MPHGFKAGGRTKGTPNKKTQALAELIEENHSGFNPILEMINIYKQEKTPVDLKVSILKDIAPYLFPRRKSVDTKITADIDSSCSYDLSMPIDDLVKELKRQR